MRELNATSCRDGELETMGGCGAGEAGLPWGTPTHIDFKPWTLQGRASWS